MKSIKIALAMLLLVSIYAGAREQRYCHFRKTCWGMTPAELKKNESFTFVEDGRVPDGKEIVYSGTLADFSVLLRYTFKMNKLVEAEYELEQPVTEEAVLLANLRTLKNLLIKKYGENYSESNPIGVRFHYEWQFFETLIILELKDLEQDTISIRYVSALKQQVEDELEMKREKEILDAL
jgi:hypothetical protein